MSNTEASADDHPWFACSQEVYTFAVVLRTAELMPEDEDEYWAKPWHWEPEHAMWVEAGSPQCPQSGAPPDLAWQRFVRNPAQQQ